MRRAVPRSGGGLLSASDTLRAEADEHFSDARLEHQHDRILRHLQGPDGNARILPFPVAPSYRSPRLWPRLANRWIAGAAAAGLVVGLAAGLMLDTHSWGALGRRSPNGIIARTTPSRPGSIEGLRVSDAADERLLLEIDEALHSPRTPELQPFDALTPHVQEIAVTFK